MISNDYNGRERILRIAVGITALVLVMTGWVGASVLSNEHSDLFYLKNGYAIRIMAIDQETFPIRLWVALEKEDIKIDDAILNSGEVYSYKKGLDEINLKIEGFADKENSIVFLKNLYQSSNGEILLNFESSTLYPSNPISSFQETTDRVNSYFPISGNIGAKQAASIGSAVRQIIVDDDGPADYPTIQRAIEAANSGDTIHVKNGTYFEHLLILKDNLMIIGENKESTIIDGGGYGDVIVLMGANNNTIKEITVQNGKPDPAVFPPVSGYSRIFLKENYSFTANAIEPTTSPRYAWITLRKNDTIIDEIILEEGTLFKEDRSGLILSLRVDKIFAGSSGQYILFSNITQYSDTNHNIIVQNETAMLKVGENDDFVPLIGGIEWDLDENYTLSILDIDNKAFPGQAMLLLSKNAAPVDFKIMKTGDIYTFSKGGKLILKADIEAIFGGPGAYLAKLSHVYQYSESTSGLLLNDGLHMYIIGSPRTVKWELFQNYSLTAMDIDSRSFPRFIWFELSKDGVVIEDKILESGDDYSFYKDSSKILSLNVGEIFDGRKSDLAFINEIYQYSEADLGTVLKQNETHIFQLSSSSGIDWPLYENYTISFMDVDINIFPAHAWMQMKKNGDIVDDRLVTVNQIYSYTNPSGRVIFNGKIDTIFSGNLDFLKIIHADQYSEVDGTPLILNATRSFYPVNLEYAESLSDKFQLFENYYITPVDISARTSPRRVWIRLYKSGTLVDEKILSAPMNSLDFQDYSYYSGGRMIISAKLDTIFSGAISDMMQFRDFYQYSEIDGAPLMYLLKKTLIGGARLSINNAGMTLDGSNWNNLQDLRVLNNFYGIYLSGSNNNIYNNYFNNTINQVIKTGSNTWNTAKGGNFWAYPNGTGFSQKCADADKNGICDAQYTLDSNNIDYLPLARNMVGLPKTGDINGNGQLTLVDAIYLAKHVGGFSGYEIIYADGDINGNGQVTLVDAIYLAKHVGGFIGYEQIY